MAESILLAVTRIATFAGPQALSSATGFFFKAHDRQFLVTSRHVVFDPLSAHLPDRLEFTVHVDATDLTRNVVMSLALFRAGIATWRQGTDAGGEVDIAAIELDRGLLPADAAVSSFTADQLVEPPQELQVGTPVHIVGFPLGFYDTVHNLPVVRQASIASSFGVRFQGQGYFLTDARTHRGMSGAPVVLRPANGPSPWALLGIHGSMFDMRDRDRALDDALGLNIAWYADMLRVLTAETTGARDGT
jgi:S1-C subfamily serine protease